MFPVPHSRKRFDLVKFKGMIELWHTIPSKVNKEGAFVRSLSGAGQSKITEAILIH